MIYSINNVFFKFSYLILGWNLTWTLVTDLWLEDNFQFKMCYCNIFWENSCAYPTRTRRVQVVTHVYLSNEWMPSFASLSRTMPFCSVLFSSVAQSCLTLCNPMNHSTPGLPVYYQLLDFTQTHVHQVSDAIQPSHPLLSPSPPAPNPSQLQSLFQWVNSSHEVAKVLEFQL